MKEKNFRTDEDLVKLLRQGDRRAYTEIYNRYKRLLYLFAFKRLGNKEDVWDIVHEVFLSLWIHHESIHINYTFSTYLHSAVRNKIADHLARQEVSARYLDSFRQYLETAVPATDELARNNELQILIEREIALLPEKMRQVFELSRKSNYSRKEIAGKLGLSEETVKSHMHQALKKLKSRLGVLFSVVFL